MVTLFMSLLIYMEEIAKKLYRTGNISRNQFLKLHADIQRRDEFADHQLLKHIVEEFSCEACAKKHIKEITKCDDTTEAIYDFANYYNKKGYDLINVTSMNPVGIRYTFEEHMGEMRLYHKNGTYIHLYKGGHIMYDLI